MAVKIGINGFGRIGRLTFRAAMHDPDIDIVAINDLTDSKTMAHLLKYDSVHGVLKDDISYTDNSLTVNGKTTKVTREKDPANLNWGADGVTVVVESTGFFTKRDDAAKHIAAGAKKVLISAPATDPDFTVVFGVNDGDYDASKHHIISNASCTTNCLAPVVKVLNDSFGLERAYMTTIHAYTGDQKLLDYPHKDLRRSRAGAMSIIPTKTGAARAIGEVIPSTKGKLDGFAMRVPTPDGSCVDLVAELSKEATKEEINAAMKAACDGPMKGYFEYTEDPIVSIDVVRNPASSVFDALSTMSMGKFIKVVSWYDNEWGYSNRLIDLIKLV